MHVRVLGSGAGGGFPQWNCACPNCRGLRTGSIRARPRTQASIAISAAGERFVLINASPDIRQQIEAAPRLAPRIAPRSTPIEAVLFTNADIDHIAGLLTLRESQPLSLYATDRVQSAVVEDNAMLRAIALMPGQSTWHEIALDRPPAEIVSSGGAPTGLALEAFAVPGKPPAYRGVAPDPKDTIALRISEPRSGRALVYAPGVKSLDRALLERLGGGDVLFFDGTCYTDDELSRLGIAQKMSLAMGHMPISGAAGSLEALRPLAGVRRIYTHINNTNPILDEDSPERRAVESSGIEIAFDGMELEL
jgi:pyrroloquinoline quinone biosynthesis protein B